MHADLLQNSIWKLEEQCNDDGFNYHHHNVYNHADDSYFVKAARDMLNHPASKIFMHNLTQRDCHGQTFASPSYYMPRDHSLPHTDFKNARTVAFVWHLSKNWIPEWGGALYWHPDRRFLHASYNTLSLFSVSPKSFHFVTSVSPYATERRLTFNGWWSSSFIPTINDYIEDMYDTDEKRYDMSWEQWFWCQNVDANQFPEERREKVKKLQNDLKQWHEADASAIHTVEL